MINTLYKSTKDLWGFIGNLLTCYLCDRYLGLLDQYMSADPDLVGNAYNCISQGFSLKNGVRTSWDIPYHTSGYIHTN